MEGREYILSLTIAVMAAFAYALSAVGCRWGRGFSEKPLSWLIALERRTTAGRWILVATGLCIIAGLHFVTGTKRHPDPWLVFLVVGIVGGLGNMFWELSSYARLEIEVRKRLTSR